MDPEIIVEIVTQRWKSATPCKISVIRYGSGLVLKAIDLSRESEERTTLAAVLSAADAQKLGESLLGL